MLPGIQNYQIIEELGRGGMATVYKAWQPSLSRLVALKVLPPYLAHDEELLLRFRHEARAVAKLRHPHIVQVFDFHQEDDWFYLAMEFVAGGSMQQKLARAGRLAPPEALAIARQVAEGLHHAHDKGFIHRDIKPSNILLSEDGQAVITDFGIVKAIEGSGLTNTVYGGMGTCEYMSPEQAKGEQLGRQSDLYSLGVVLYEALTGSPPFQGDSPLAVMHSQIYDEPPGLIKSNPNVNAQIEEVVMKLLAKDPARRFATGLELVAALASLDGGAPAGGGPASPVVDRATLVRRDTRVAKAPGLRAPAGRPNLSTAAQGPGAAPDPAQPFNGRLRQPWTPPRTGVVLVGALMLLASWAAGFAVSHAYIWPAPGPAAAGAAAGPAPKKKAAAPAAAEAKPPASVAATGAPAPPAASATTATTAAIAPPATAWPPAAASPAPRPRRGPGSASPPVAVPPPADQDISIVVQ